jgi:hypothetical protein
MLKFAWKPDLVDCAAWNSEYTEEVDMDEFKEMLAADVARGEWDDTDSDIDDEVFTA